MRFANKKRFRKDSLYLTGKTLRLLARKSVDTISTSQDIPITVEIHDKVSKLVSEN